MYLAHPDPVLQRLFAERACQGVPPAEAAFIFIGLDANFSLAFDGNRVSLSNANRVEFPQLILVGSVKYSGRLSGYKVYFQGLDNTTLEDLCRFDSPPL